MCVSAKQIHNSESQEAFENSGYFSKLSEKSVGAITISTHYIHSLVEKKPSLFLLSIESSS